MRAGEQRSGCNSRLQSGMPDYPLNPRVRFVRPGLRSVRACQEMLHRLKPVPAGVMWRKLQPVFRSNKLWIGFLLAGTLSTSGCLFKKQPRAFHPPPLRPTNAAVVEPKLPPVVEPPGELELSATFEAPALVIIMPDLAPPPKPVPAPPKRPPVAAAPKPAPAAETPAPPKLGQIFTADQTREYNRTLDESLDRVRRALETLAKKALSAEQTDILERIRTFQKQAEQAREQDLVTAVNLARRADLLAKDLLEQRLP